MNGTKLTVRRRAFTMIEVMVVVAILGIVMGMTVIALNSASAETSMSTTEGALQNSTNQFMERLLADLRSASRASIAIDSDGAGISFQVPVDATGPYGVPDGLTDFHPDGKPVYGATFGRRGTPDLNPDDGVWDPVIAYRFRQNEGDVLDEPALGIDVNGDLDETDSFRRGRITRAAPDSNGVTAARATSDRWFLYGDEDGDGVVEPIFRREADGRIRIRLLAADVMERQETPIRSLVTTWVEPYNP
ncbi:MAG: prepilin-type N-terminal cleavage/methylation domain-containing protein [Planctomycetota bacterium]|jgi:prepilin-type N-terminal cleavage/methylation domain-containing protein